MTPTPRIALLNPNTNAETTRVMARIASDAVEDAFFDARTVPFGPPIITTEAGLHRAGEQVVSSGKILHREGFDGILVAGFGDPGLHCLREIISTPVTGIAEAAFAEATQHGGKYSVVTTTPDLKASIHDTASRYGYGENLVSVRITPGAPEVVMAEPERLAQALHSACLESIRLDRAEIIIIGGGPLALAAETIASELPVSLINPVIAGAKLACARAGIVRSDGQTAYTPRASR
ncbi:aspartate/glutamate racemase family protein [Devosia sp.]|uniref:aspartate/glutamate racemase family protein n=1 Tax=Devosia sp. TaxID=1871048 RepID=UPI003A90819C